MNCPWKYPYPFTSQPMEDVFVLIPPSHQPSPYSCLSFILSFKNLGFRIHSRVEFPMISFGVVRKIHWNYIMLCLMLECCDGWYSGSCILTASRVDQYSWSNHGLLLNWSILGQHLIVILIDTQSTIIDSHATLDRLSHKMLNSKKLWKHSPAARVPTAFFVLQNFYSCFYNLIETWNMFSLS